jgi:hypothetical protein
MAEAIGALPASPAGAEDAVNAALREGRAPAALVHAWARAAGAVRQCNSCGEELVHSEELSEALIDDWLEQGVLADDEARLVFGPLKELIEEHATCARGPIFYCSDHLHLLGIDD